MYQSGSGNTSPQHNHSHTCQIHQQENSLVQAVLDFLATGASLGENLVLVTRPSRQGKVLDWMKAKLPDAGQLAQDGRLTVHSSFDLVESVCRDGTPAWDLFEPATRELLDRATASGRIAVRLYGDAVSELWQSGRHAAAVEIEGFWNRMIRTTPGVNVFCGYLFDTLSADFYSPYLEQLGCEHDGIRAGADELDLQCALDQASREVRGSSLSSAKITCAAGDWRQRVPLSMRWVLWLLEHEPGKARLVLGRARELHRAKSAVKGTGIAAAS